MTTLKSYKRYIFDLEQSETPLQVFNCPHCQFETKTIAPGDNEQVYDSFTSCPACDRQYFKIVRKSGVVTKKLP